MKTRYPQQKLTIIGGGIIGLLEAYYSFLEAKKNGQQLRVTIFEKNKKLADTTTCHIVPSLTVDEILSVVPRGKQLEEASQRPFNQPGGIRVNDVPGVDNEIAQKFSDAVQKYSLDEDSHNHRTQTLLALGRKSMDLWQALYDEGDEELKAILLASNFNPCREPLNEDKIVLHDGYRIDLIYNVEDAYKKASDMKADYEKLGYKKCKLLSPQEVIEIDPTLQHFCESNSERNESGELIWKNSAVAIFRPGGCINTAKFIPQFHDYLQRVMGQYIDEKGVSKNCFQMHFDREVTHVAYAGNNKNSIKGLQFFNQSIVKQNKHPYEKSDYVFCPGESVGTLKKLGFAEPDYVGFAGASLLLNIPLEGELIERYKDLNHCMEVQQVGVVLAWQAQFDPQTNSVFIGGAGTKANYSNQIPTIYQAFAIDRNLLQLNMFNDVFPELFSSVLGRDTKGKQLNGADLEYLVMKKIAQRWVGRRAVTADGMPTVGAIYNEKGEVDNAGTITHAGSGGVSFGPALVNVFNNRKTSALNPLVTDVLSFSNSRRHP